MHKIDKIHTPCKNCVYAKYEGNTQTDCYLGFIDKLKNNNVEILEAYDYEKEFFVVNNKKCIGYRENSWFVKKDLDHLSIDEKVDHFRKNNFIRYLLLVNLQAFDDSENLERLQLSLSNLSIHPSKIIFVRFINNQKYDYHKLLNILDEMNFKGKWRIQTVLDENITFRYAMHEAISFNKKYRFILSVDSNNPTDMNNIVTTANKIVYDDLDRIVVLKNTDNNVHLFSAPNYRQLLLVDNKHILDATEIHTTI